MKEIEVEEYVRLARNQGINRIIEVEIDEDDKRYILDDNIADKYGEETCCLFENEIKDEIVKHSKQLIDLIEIGDFVNGHRVINEIWGEDDNNLYLEIEGEFNKAQYIGEKDIETILTEENYMANCYKVGGKDE